MLDRGLGATALVHKSGRSTLNTTPQFRAQRNALSALGRDRQITLYLDRCQIDTPLGVVKMVWQLIRERRKHVGKVVDFGAGDARFARYGPYLHYVGYEIDRNRCDLKNIPKNAQIVNACAFSEVVEDAD